MQQSGVRLYPSRFPLTDLRRPSPGLSNRLRLSQGHWPSFRVTIANDLSHMLRFDRPRGLRLLSKSVWMVPLRAEGHAYTWAAGVSPDTRATSLRQAVRPGVL